jgi:hypothetical protein
VIIFILKKRHKVIAHKDLEHKELEDVRKKKEWLKHLSIGIYKQQGQKITLF